MPFDSIRNNISRCQKLVNAEAHFARDVALGAAARQYIYYVPNLLNDVYNTNVSYAWHDLRIYRGHHAGQQGVHEEHVGHCHLCRKR